MGSDDERERLAPEECVFLVTGELASFSSQKTLAVGYVIAPCAEQAVRAQIQAQPNLQVSGVVSLAELKKQVAKLEAARMGQLPALLVREPQAEAAR